MSERSRWFHVETLEAPVPDKPRGLSATATHGQVDLTWNDPEDDTITGYVILRRVRVNDTGGDFSVLVADTGTAALTYADTTVAAGLTYTYRIKAINGAGVSERSRWSHVDTPAAPEPEEEQAAEPPDKPRGLEATATHNSVTLTWDEPNDDEGVTGYAVMRWTLGYNATGFVTIAADTGTADPSYTDETVEPENEYLYHVRAINAQGESEQSEWLRVHTPEAPDPAVIQLPGPPPSAPAGLIATFGIGGVFLSWQAPVEDAGTVTGYEVLRTQGGGQLTTLVANTGNAASTYTDTTAGGASERYAYRVRAIRDGERSADSNEARVQLPPAAPRRVVSGAASDLVLLSWADPGDDSVTGYRIMRRQAIADVASDFVTLAEDTGTAETSYADDTVENGRVYVYRVLAIGPGGLSEPSRDVRVRTTVPVPPPDRPRGLPSQTTQQPRQSVSEPAGDDFPDDETTAGRVEAGGSVTGNIDANDLDSFAVYLEAGHQYQIDVEGADTSQGTLADPELFGVYRLRPDGDNFDRISNDTRDRDSGVGKNARHTLTMDDRPSGTYYLLARGGNSTTGTYRLSVMVKAGSGYGRYMPLEGRLQPGGSLSGTLGVPTAGIFSYYFALEDLEVGRYTVDFGTGGIHSIHHFLTDRNKTGHVTLDDTWVIVDQGHGRRSFTFDVRPGMEGTHYVLLNILKDDSGSYNGTLEKAMPHLSVGRTGLVGEVPADSDGFAVHMEFFSVDLEAGQEYRVDIKGKHSRDEECEDNGGNEEACTLDHTMLGNIQAPNGEYVGGDGNFDDSDDDVGGSVLHFYGGGDDRGNTRFFFTADEDGTHFLKVGGRLFKTEDGSGFRPGTFRLSVREVSGGRSAGRALNGVRATAGPNALSAARKTVAPPPLTARFAGVPEEHDGASPFTLQVAFSSAIETGHRTLRDHSLSVSGGAATAARPVVAGHWDLWEIEVRPASDAAVQVSLPPTRACGDTGAVCSADGRALSNGIVTTVPGPATARHLSGSAADDTLSGRARRRRAARRPGRRYPPRRRRQRHPGWRRRRPRGQRPGRGRRPAVRRGRPRHPLRRQRR